MCLNLTLNSLMIVRIKRELLSLSNYVFFSKSNSKIDIIPLYVELVQYLQKYWKGTINLQNCRLMCDTNNLAIKETKKMKRRLSLEEKQILFEKSHKSTKLMTVLWSPIIFVWKWARSIMEAKSLFLSRRKRRKFNIFRTKIRKIKFDYFSSPIVC